MENFFYSYHTVSSEQGDFIKGTLNLRAVRGDENYCEAVLVLPAGKYDMETRKPICKRYEGSTVISMLNTSCFSMMVSAEYSDFCCLNWTHIYLNDEKLACRYAACLTTSAGISNNRRPVMLKAIISRCELSDDDLKVLSGQLNMNSSEIEINKKVFEQQVVPRLTDNRDVNYLKGLARKEHIYVWSEGDIRNNRKNPFTIGKMEMINLLRQYANSEPYIKISGKADSFLFDYLQKYVVGKE